MREIKAGTLGALRALVMVLVLLLPAAARAQESSGCAPGSLFGPILTPATLTPADLRCFPLAPPKRAIAAARDRTPVFPLALGATGAAAIGVAIGFGVGGASLDASSSSGAVRVDYAIANVALSIGLTSLVTAIVLALVHR